MTVGIKDVARHAGVSVATVSRALSNGPISDETRRKVEEAVRATGYLPNLSARRLRSQHSQTIGLIVSDIRNPFFTAVSRAVEDAAYQAGMRVILCNTDENPHREDMYLRLMQEERVTGVIFAPTRSCIERLAEVSPGFPMVLIDRSGPPGLHDAVVLDNEGASAQLVEHLYANGYRRIAGLFGNTSTTGIEREAGYVAAMTARGLTPRSYFLSPQPEEAERMVLALMAGGVLSEDGCPDAFIASNGRILLGVCKAMFRTGLRMPEDVGVAGFDNEDWTGLIGRGLTVIEQPVQEIGQSAMALLFERLEQADLPVRKIVLSGRCVVRGSSIATPNPSGY